jgi:hypothetical protein
MVCAIAFVNFSYSQEPNSDLKFKNYEVFFEQPREEIFLDLPKNTFFLGEPIQFAGYVFDQIAKVPSFDTANVYCSVYNEFGNLVSSKIFYADKGKFHGEIEIPKEKGSGKYYIKAYTNWMKNFSEEFMFIQDIFIIDETADQSNQTGRLNNNIHIYPEGGNLVGTINNSVGFSLIINEQKSSPYESCHLVDDLGNQIIQNIRINQQGYGKFSFVPELEKQYYLNVRLESGELIHKALPKANEQGVTIVLNPTSEKNISLEINSDEETFKRLKKAPITLAIHRDGVLKLVNYQLKRQNSSVILPKGVMLPGLNKLSIFDEDYNLLAERLFFNDTHIRSLKNSVATELKEKANDSLVVSLTIDGLRRGATSQLSVSVLPNESKAHDYNWSLGSWFLLQSYFTTQMKSELFSKKMNRQRLFDLDLFLLNNEWNRYDWSDISQPQTEFDHTFEKGISLKGQFSGDDALKNKELVLYQKSIGEFFSTKIDNQLRFSVNDLYLVEDEPILFFTKNYAMRKYTKVDLNYYPAEETDHLSSKEIERFLKSKSINLEKSLNPIPVIFPNTELLDEIVVESKKKPKLTRNPRLMRGIMSGEKLVEAEARTTRLSQYITKKGFRVFRILERNQFLVLPTKNIIDNHPPDVYLNGFRTEDPIHDMPLASVDEFYYHHYSLGRSDSGEIHIYTRTEKAPKDLDTKLLQKIAKVGFSTKSSSNKLKYTDFMKNHFVSFGSVYWNGDIELERGRTTVELKFPSYSLKEFRIYINGFSDKGDIISASKYISVD